MLRFDVVRVRVRFFIFFWQIVVRIIKCDYVLLNELNGSARVHTIKSKYDEFIVIMKCHLKKTIK